MDDPKWIDVSDFIKEMNTSSDDFIESIPGLKATGPITITVFWDPDQVTCDNCGQGFRHGPEGFPTILNTSTGARIAACPQCFIALGPVLEP